MYGCPNKVKGQEEEEEEEVLFVKAGTRADALTKA